MNYWARLSIIIVISMLLAFWLNEIIRKYEPLTIFVGHIVIFCLLTGMLWSHLYQLSTLIRALCGALIGYTAAVVSAMLVELLFGGVSELIRLDKWSLLYPYPLLSLGWVHGAAVLALLSNGAAHYSRNK